MIYEHALLDINNSNNKLTKKRCYCVSDIVVLIHISDQSVRNSEITYFDLQYSTP